MSEPANILPDGAENGPVKLSEDMLMQYLDGKLPAAKQHEVEQWLSAEGMESDAIEGLRGINPADTRHTINKLNRNLKNTLLHKKRKRRPANTDYLTWIALAIILMLAVIAYIVIRKSI